MFFSKCQFYYQCRTFCRRCCRHKIQYKQASTAFCHYPLYFFISTILRRIAMAFSSGIFRLQDHFYVCIFNYRAGGLTYLGSIFNLYERKKGNAKKNIICIADYWNSGFSSPGIWSFKISRRCRDEELSYRVLFGRPLSLQANPWIALFYTHGVPRICFFSKIYAKFRNCHPGIFSGSKDLFPWKCNFRVVLFCGFIDNFSGCDP